MKALNVGVLFATPLEARPLLERLGAEEIPARGYSLYRAASGVRVAVSLQMGPDGARDTTARFLAEHPIRRLWNVGIAGCLSDRFGVGDIVRITDIHWNSQVYPAGFSREEHRDLLHELPGGCLVTRGTPVFDAELRRVLAVHGDLVDMEGGAVAAALAEMDSPPELLVLKGVSDFAGEGDHTHLHANLERVCRKLSDLLCEVIEQ